MDYYFDILSQKTSAWAIGELGLHDFFLLTHYYSVDLFGRNIENQCHFFFLEEGDEMRGVLFSVRFKQRQ